MRAALVVAGRNLRQRLRDRSAVVIAVIAPLVVSALMSLAFSGVESFHYTLGVVDADGGPVAAGLLQALRQPELAKVVTVRRLDSRAAAAQAVRDKRVAAALVLPAGFSASVTGPRPLPIATLTSVDDTVAGTVTSSIASTFVAQLNADRLSVATALAAGVPADQSARLAAAAARLQIPVQAVQRALGSRPLAAVSYYAPAMAIFFVLFTVSFTARSFVAEREQGTVERLRATPAGARQIVGGTVLSAFVFAALAMGTIAVVTSAVFGADWGDPLAATVVGLSMVLAVTALTALVMGLARTQRQAEGISSAVVFGLALLGGNFVFVSVAPDVMQRAALLTPNGWALRAYMDLATGGGGLGTVAVPVAAILGFAAVVGAAAVALAPRAVRV